MNLWDSLLVFIQLGSKPREWCYLLTLRVGHLTQIPSHKDAQRLM